VDDDEVLVEDRLGFRGLDKPIEFLAPPSPGGVEDRKDRPLTLGGRFGIAKERRGGRRCLGCGRDCAQQRAEDESANGRSVWQHLALCDYHSS
jgi:hypothetical protein